MKLIFNQQLILGVLLMAYNEHEFAGWDRKLSCGIILLNNYDEALMMHVSGQDFWDIPKGTQNQANATDKYETPSETMHRKLYEETGIVINNAYSPDKKDESIKHFRCKNVVDLGFYPYNKHKDLWLFMARISDISSDELRSIQGKTKFDDHGVEKYTNDEFRMIHIDLIAKIACGSFARLFEEQLYNDIIKNMKHV